MPPIAETVPGFEIRPWWGVSGPAGMPTDVVDKLYNATTAILKDPDTTISHHMDDTGEAKGYVNRPELVANDLDEVRRAIESYL